MRVSQTKLNTIIKNPLPSNRVFPVYADKAPFPDHLMYYLTGALAFIIILCILLALLLTPEEAQLPENR